MPATLPLATLHGAVLDFIRDREDVVLFGAYAVNAYVPEPRMTQDIDLLSTRMEAVATDLRDHLAARFRIALRLRDLGADKGLRLYQLQKEGNRHLVNFRSVGILPDSRRLAGILVLAPADLVAAKALAFHQRRGQPKSGTDWRDLALLLLTFPELRADDGPVAERLRSLDASPAALDTWRELARQTWVADDDGDGKDGDWI
ncbi:MAG: nucleotidyl transferase AbiEii/AbiGii toxin family protein [Ardenticatenia bacterium]|nr:nucleotidyl transferase AbiEii/AbiGii toxin family protein [Ardenticatenia bacterium]